MQELSGLILGLDPKLAAIIIVAVCYFIIFTEKVNRAVIALLGAAVMILSGILTQKTALAGIDFNTLALLVGMMTIVAISERSGMFQFVAVWGGKESACQSAWPAGCAGGGYGRVFGIFG